MISKPVPETESKLFHSILSISRKYTTLGEMGKFGTVAGTIGTVVGVFFNYDSSLLVSFTAISGITWFCCGKIAQDFESQAQAMLQYAKDSQKNNPNALFDSPHLYKPLLLKPSKPSHLARHTWEVMQGRLWPLIDNKLSQGNNQYHAMKTFRVLKLGEIVISTDSAQNKAILQYPRYSENVKGGHGWDTFARICFGWENLIMASGEKHKKMLKALSPLFTKPAVKNSYFENLKGVTLTTVLDWKMKNQGIDLLHASMEHSCRSVTTCFLGKQAANSKEIIDAVQNLMGIFWDLAQFKPMAVVHQASRQILPRSVGDPLGYWHSHDILEKAIEQSRALLQDPNVEGTEHNFISRLLDKQFTPQEIIDNMKMLYFAGTETTGSLITTALGHLAANRSEQDKLLDELHEARVENIEDLNDEKLQGLKRLQAALYESLRLVPPIPAQVRKIKTDVGNYAYIIDHFHRLRDCTLVGNDPEQFKPDRILENSHLKKEIEKTFGSGHSPCIGKRFALSETLLLIAATILQGHFELVEGDPSLILMEAGAHLSLNLKIRFKEV